jgi:hypothetical protein
VWLFLSNLVQLVGLGPRVILGSSGFDYLGFRLMDLHTNPIDYASFSDPTKKFFIMFIVEFIKVIAFIKNHNFIIHNSRSFHKVPNFHYFGQISHSPRL